MESSVEVRRSLEDLALAHEALRALATKLGGFNVFEAMGQVRRELRHSDFLGFLLDPSGAHGFGDECLRLLVGTLLQGAGDIQSRQLLLKALVGDLEHVQVSRETMNVDILCVDHQNRLVIIIENKTFSSEHSDQLRRYKEAVAQRYPSFSQVLVFLTPEGDEASDKQYLSLSYTSLIEIIECLRLSSGQYGDSHLDRTLVDYQRAVRRHITMSDPELEELARSIYARHKQALDFIFERRPDLISNIGDALEGSLTNWAEDLTVLQRSKTLIVFAPRDWMSDDFLFLSQADQSKLQTSRPYLNFQLIISERRTKLSLLVDQAPLTVRDQILKHADGLDANLLPNRTQTPGQKSTTVMYKEILGPEDYETGDDTSLPKLAADRLESLVSRGEIDKLRLAFSSIN